MTIENLKGEDMKKKIIGVLLCVAMASTLMAGCGSSSDDSSTEEETTEEETTEEETTEEETPDESSSEGLGTIGILMPSLETEFFANTADSCAEVLEAAGYNTNIQGFDNDASEAVTCIENFITEGVIGIAYMTVDKSGDDALAEAMDKGIVVLTCGVENDNYNICQIADNYSTGYAIGEMASEYINETFDGSAEVACIESTKSENMINRVDGYKDALAELCPGAEIVYEMDAVETGDGTTFAENLNVMYPDCQVVLSYSDTFVDEVNQVWTAYGYPDTAAIYGHDAEEKVLASIAEGGYVKGTMYLGDSGEMMAEGMIGYLNGEYEDGTLVENGGVSVTIDNVNEYYFAE